MIVKEIKKRNTELCNYPKNTCTISQTGLLVKGSGFVTKMGFQKGSVIVFTDCYFS